MTSRCTRSARWRCRPRIRRSCGPGRARARSARTFRSATGCGNRRTAGIRGRTWGSRERGAWAGSSCIRATRMSCTWRRSATPTARRSNGASSARPTAARAGSACSSSTRTPAPTRWSWTRTTRGRSWPRPGTWTSRPGSATAAAPAAASTSRWTAATAGAGSRATASPCGGSARSRSACRPATRIGSTRSSRPATACPSTARRRIAANSGAPTTAARRGS